MDGDKKKDGDVGFHPESEVTDEQIKEYIKQGLMTEQDLIQKQNRPEKPQEPSRWGN